MKTWLEFFESLKYSLFVGLTISRASSRGRYWKQSFLSLKGLNQYLKKVEYSPTLKVGAWLAIINVIPLSSTRLAILSSIC